MPPAVSGGWSLRRIAMARRNSRKPSAAARTSSRAGLPTGRNPGDGLVVPGDHQLLAPGHAVENQTKAGLRFQYGNARYYD